MRRHRQLQSGSPSFWSIWIRSRMYCFARPMLSCMNGIIGLINSSLASTSGVRLPMFCITWGWEWHMGTTSEVERERKGSKVYICLQQEGMSVIQHGSCITERSEAAATYAVLCTTNAKLDPPLSHLTSSVHIQYVYMHRVPAFTLAHRHTTLAALAHLCNQLQCPFCALVGVVLPEGEQLGREDSWDEEPQEDETGDGNVGDVLRETAGDRKEEHEIPSHVEPCTEDTCTDMQHQ